MKVLFAMFAIGVLGLGCASDRVETEPARMETEIMTEPAGAELESWPARDGLQRPYGHPKKLPPNSQTAPLLPPP